MIMREKEMVYAFFVDVAAALFTYFFAGGWLGAISYGLGMGGAWLGVAAVIAVYEFCGPCSFKEMRSWAQGGLTLVGDLIGTSVTVAGFGFYAISAYTQDRVYGQLCGFTVTCEEGVDSPLLVLARIMEGATTVFDGSNPYRWAVVAFVLALFLKLLVRSRAADSR